MLPHWTVQAFVAKKRYRLLSVAAINGPAVLPLDHYDACILPNGNLGVNKAVVVDPSTRLMA